MPVELNHTIVSAKDPLAAATFLAEILGLPPPKKWGPFHIVTTDNRTDVDFIEDDGEISSRHFAFLVSETEFDEIFARIKERNISHWADPGQTRQGEVNHNDGGRGTYFENPDGHLLEILTRPYGSGGRTP